MIDGLGESESLEIPPTTHLFHPTTHLNKLIALLSGYAYLNPNLTDDGKDRKGIIISL